MRPVSKIKGTPSAREKGTCILTANSVDNIIRGCPKEFSNYGELVDMVFPGEQRLSFEHLREDAPCTPNIYLHVVLLPGKHDLRRTIVPRRNIARHLRVLNASQPKIANLQIAVLIDQNVARFQVAMNDTRGVDIFQPTL